LSLYIDMSVSLSVRLSGWLSAPLSCCVPSHNVFLMLPSERLYMVFLFSRHAATRCLVSQIRLLLPPLSHFFCSFSHSRHYVPSSPPVPLSSFPFFVSPSSAPSRSLRVSLSLSLSLSLSHVLCWFWLCRFVWLVSSFFGRQSTFCFWSDVCFLICAASFSL